MQLNIAAVTHRYSRHATRAALSAVSLILNHSSATAIMGPSGSGKSTLLSIAAGLLRPSRGTASLHTTTGTLATGRHLQAETAWVFQSLHMLPKRTVLDNVMLGCLRQCSTRQQACNRALLEIARVGLANRSTALIEELSGGEIQRIALARALTQERPLIIADEPTAQLDHANTQLVADALRMAASSRIVLVATHDEFLASQLDRLVRLRDGTVISDQILRAGTT
ncbi:MAG: ATP-binding cassette domain-containing protein [Bifidobacteriaceae bacterium]|jgi:ABC-type lipoprotein export system ATPase subunit|nr:ATP-binding cassette domain-containing protein [Bifidobacteriaceae bacterium]